MSYFDNVLKHIQKAANYELFGCCKLYSAINELRKLESDGIPPIWIRCTPCKFDNLWSFYAYTEEDTDSGAQLIYLDGSYNSGSSEQHVFMRTVPGALGALENAFKQAQAAQVIRTEYVADAMTGCAMLFASEDVPNHLIITSSQEGGSNDYEFLFFRDEQYDDGKCLKIAIGDTLDTHKEALLSLGVASAEGQQIEDKFLAEIAELIHGIQEKLAA